VLCIGCGNNVIPFGEVVKVLSWNFEWMLAKWVLVIKEIKGYEILVRLIEIWDIVALTPAEIAEAWVRVSKTRPISKWEHQP
jgi:hypothetical protein